jgi:spermidine/putrescine transport system permease protein
MSEQPGTSSSADIAEATAAFRSPPERGHRSLRRRRKAVPYALLAPGGIYLLAAFLIPLVIVVYTSLESGGILSGGFSFTWNWSNYTDSLSQYGDIYIRSLVYSGTATILCLLLAYPMAYWIAFYGGKWKSTLFFMILLPFFVSFVIRTVQWKFILGDNGLIFGPLKNWGLLPDNFRVLASPYAVIAGITYNFLPFTALPLYVALDRIDKRLVEAAKDLYATRFEAFRKVVLPLSFPGVFAAIILTFVPATGDYVNSSVLGGPGTYMIGNIIQDKFLFSANYPDAAALSVILMLGMLVIALIYARVLGTEDAALAAGVAG